MKELLALETNAVANWVPSGTVFWTNSKVVAIHFVATQFYCSLQWGPFSIKRSHQSRSSPCQSESESVEQRFLVSRDQVGPDGHLDSGSMRDV